MKKADLIAAIAKKSEITKGDVEDVLDALAEVVRDELSEGGKVQLTDLGTFSTKERAARQGRNPATGASIEIPAKTVPVFKATKSLADALA